MFFAKGRKMYVTIWLLHQRQSLNSQSWVTESFWEVKAVSYPQSGAGHHLQSGSEARHLLSRNSSYFSSRAASSKMSATCRGASLSAHSGQLSWTRLSVISMRRYWRRQHRHERWLQPSSSGSCSAGWRTRHRGHSRRLGSPEASAPLRDGWLDERGFEGVLDAASLRVVAAWVVVVGVAEAAAGAEVNVEGRSCCCVWWWCVKGVAAPPLGALEARELRLLLKRLWKEMRLRCLPAAWHLGLGTPPTDEWGDSESFSDPIFIKDVQTGLSTAPPPGLSKRNVSLVKLECKLFSDFWLRRLRNSLLLLFLLWETKHSQQKAERDNKQKIKEVMKV